MIPLLLACAAEVTIPDTAAAVDCAYVTAGDLAWDGFIRDHADVLGLGDAAGAWAGEIILPSAEGGLNCELAGVVIQVEVWADGEWAQTGHAAWCSGDDYGEAMARNVYLVPEEQEVSAGRGWAWDAEG